MKLIRSIGYALQGIKYCLISEKNFRIQLIAALIAIACGIILHIDLFEWMLILFCLAFVLALEMINTSIEKLSNIVDSNIHPGIKIIKDVAAGAVSIAALLSLVLGCFIFIPKFLSLIKH
jgi:diacylglycerol kinase